MDSHKYYTVEFCIRENEVVVATVSKARQKDA